MISIRKFPTDLVSSHCVISSADDTLSLSHAEIISLLYAYQWVAFFRKKEKKKRYFLSYEVLTFVALVCCAVYSS